MSVHVREQPDITICNEFVYITNHSFMSPVLLFFHPGHEACQYQFRYFFTFLNKLLSKTQNLNYGILFYLLQEKIMLNKDGPRPKEYVGKVDCTLSLKCSLLSGCVNNRVSQNNNFSYFQKTQFGF